MYSVTCALNCDLLAPTNMGGDPYENLFSCASQLLLRAQMRYFAPQVCIADSREAADSVMVVVSGQVEVTLPFRDGGKLLRTFTRG